MKQLKFAAKKEAIGVKGRGDGLKGNRVVLSGNRKTKATPQGSLARRENDAIADIARAAALSAMRDSPPKMKKGKKEKKGKKDKDDGQKTKKTKTVKLAEPFAAPASVERVHDMPHDPVREFAREPVRAKPPAAHGALRSMGRPPSPGSLSGSSASSVVSSVASSAGLSSVSRSSSSSYSSSLSSGSYGSRSMSSGSSGSLSLSSMSSASVPRDKGFDVLRRGGGGAPSKARAEPRADEAEEAERMDILARFHALKQRGVKLSKNYTPRSSLADLRLEMGRIEHENNVQRSVQRLRRWLLAFVSGAQYVTETRYAPKFVHGRLNGFSDYVLASVEDYDPIFERISEEHGGAGGIGSTGNPMLDLAILLCTQLAMFFFMSSKPGVKPPSAEEIKRDHPDLVRQVASELATEMRNRERFEERVAAASVAQAQAQAQPAAPPPFVPAQGQAPAQAPVRRMPAPSLGFAPRVPLPQDLLPAPAPAATLEALHESTMPQKPWVSLGETLLPEPEPLMDQQPAQPAQQARDSLVDLPLIVPDAQRAQPPQQETFPVAPTNTKKLVELTDNAMATRRGRTPKAAPPPTPSVPEKSDPKVIEVK